MNVLRIILGVCIVIFVNGCGADPVGQFTFSIKDDEGVAIPNVKICLAGHKRWLPGPSFGRDEFRNKEGVTDANGMLTLKIASDQGHFGYAVQKLDRYYPYYSRDFYLFEKDKSGEMWIPYNKKIEIVLKKRGVPVVMYAKITTADEKSTLDQNSTEVGYDLMAGDWLPPHGIGKTADFYVKFEHDIRSETEYYHTMTLRFPNEGDGVIPYPVPQREQDDLVVPRMAPESGYSNPHVNHCGVNGEKSFYVTTVDDNYIMRTRTVMKDGKIIYAHYGKILGSIEGADCNKICITYFLNPNPNDRNLEVDYRDNLVKHLTELQTPTRYKNYADYVR